MALNQSPCSRREPDKHLVLHNSRKIQWLAKQGSLRSDLTSDLYSNVDYRISVINPDLIVSSVVKLQGLKHRTPLIISRPEPRRVGEDRFKRV